MKQHNGFIVLMVVLVLLLASCGLSQPPSTAVGKPLWSFSQSLVWAVDWSPDGKKIATGEDNGNIQVLDKEQGNVLLTMKGNATIDAVAWSPMEKSWHPAHGIIPFRFGKRGQESFFSQKAFPA